MFIRRGRKDFLHLRQFFLRNISACIYNDRHKNINSSLVYPVYLKDPALLKIYKSDKKYKDRLESYKPLVNKFFLEFRKTWNFNIHLTGTRANKGLTRSLYMYLQLFKTRFKKYAVFMEFINKYNIFYKKRVISYKRKTLNK